MRWDNVDEIFPSGYTILPSGMRITNEELKQSNYQTIIQDNMKFARTMITKENRYFWGDEGEFRIYPKYDIYSSVPHPNPQYYPLSVYGMQMINEFLYFNKVK